MLATNGYACITAANGVDAVRIIDTDLVPIDLLVTDVRMPGTLNGLQLADKVRARRPYAGIILISGYATDAVEREIRAKGYRLLEKPFRQFQLEAAVAEELARAPGATVIPLKREREGG